MTYISAVLKDYRKTVRVWSRNKDGRRSYHDYDAPYYFYIPDKNGSHTNIIGDTFDRLDFNTPKDFHEAVEAYKRARVDIHESDIKPMYKILSEQFLGADIGQLNVTFFDIEVDYDPEIGYSSTENPYAPINSIALYHYHSGKTVVLAVPPTGRAGISVNDLPNDITSAGEIVLFDNERDLLKRFFQEIYDSDIISGWNSDFFDVPYTYERANMVISKNAGNQLCFPDAGTPYYQEVEKFGRMQKRLKLQGRVTLDYLEVYKNFEMANKPSYALESVAEDELEGMEKLSYTGTLHQLYNDDFEEFLRYNLRDTEILKGLEDVKKYIQLAIQMSHMNTCTIDDVLGTIQISQCSIINSCHQQGMIVGDHTPPEETMGKYSGATVIDPKAGMHDYTASVDLKSLYPMTMISLNISPETIRGQFAEREIAYNAIVHLTQQMVTFIDESNGNTLRTTGEKWNKILLKKNWCISALGTVYDQNVNGIIPSVLSTWFAERKEFKGKMAEAKREGDDLKAEYYDRMQYIKKIQLNSMYGACGNKYFKFYDVRLAESTTLSGREVLYHMGRTIALKLNGEYDLEADSIVYGDTDSIYFKTYKTNPEDALKVAQDVCTYVNETYPTFMSTHFLCDEHHDSYMEAEQEVVSDRGIYIKKKYYILNVVYDDGKPVDKLKDMGVPIKKTTLPKAIKLKLTNFIKRLLKGEDWDIIGKEIVFYKDDLKDISANIRDIALPKGITKLETYTARYNAKEPDLRLPGHVAASIFWNTCLKLYKDKESPQISSGNKLEIYYLKKPIGKFKSIAVPKDMQVLPKWFEDHIVPIIDKDAQIERLVDKQMKIMISAAGIKVPTKKKILFEEGLFG